MLGRAQSATGQDESSQKAARLNQQLQTEMAKKDYEAALKTCRELLTLAPHDSGTLYNLACVQARLGQKKEALATLSQAIDDGWVDWEHMQEDEDLASLQTKPHSSSWSIRPARTNRWPTPRPIARARRSPESKRLKISPKAACAIACEWTPRPPPKNPTSSIVWLHPSSGQPMGGVMNDKVEAMAPMFLKHGYALVTFTQKNFSGWSDRDMKKLSVSLKKIGKIAGIDAKKPILFGFSAGGQVALGLWKDKPGRFGGMVLDAAYPMIMSPGGYKPMDLDTDHVDPAVKTVPILALVGGADPGAKSWQVVEASWKQAGVPLEVVLVPEKRHEWLFDKAATDRLEQWLIELSAGKLLDSDLQPRSSTQPSAPESLSATQPSDEKLQRKIDVKLDEKSAIQIAEIVLLRVYGERVLKERPWKVTKNDGTFIIKGNWKEWKGHKGGVASICINQKNAEIISITHGK